MYGSGMRAARFCTALVAMDREGRVPVSYGGEDPATGTAEALERGARFVAVEVGSAREASRVAALARDRGATVAVAYPNVAPGGERRANLTPFSLSANNIIVLNISHAAMLNPPR